MQKYFKLPYIDNLRKPIFIPKFNFLGNFQIFFTRRVSFKRYFRYFRYFSLFLSFFDFSSHLPQLSREVDITF
jgi:hypothetical protein